MNTEKKNLKLEDPGQTHQNHGIAFLSFTNKPTPEIIFSWVTISFGLLKMNQTERKDQNHFYKQAHPSNTIEDEPDREVGSGRDLG